MSRLANLSDKELAAEERRALDRMHRADEAVKRALVNYGLVTAELDRRERGREATGEKAGQSLTHH